MAKENEKKEAFVNPFERGVTYVQFLKAKGNQSVKDYCKGQLKSDQIDWLENDLNNLKQK